MSSHPAPQAQASPFLVVAPLPWPPPLAELAAARGATLEPLTFRDHLVATWRSARLTLSSAERDKILGQAFAGGHTLALVPLGFVPKAVFFDLDATLVFDESLVALAETLGRGREVDAITEQAMTGKMDFREALEIRLQALGRVPMAVVERVASQLRLVPLGEEFVSACRSLAIPVCIVSGALYPFAEHIAARLGITRFTANRMVIDGGMLHPQVIGSVVDGAEKCRWFLAEAERLRLAPTDCLGIGDGANDRFFLEETGCGLGFAPKEALWKSLSGASFLGNHSLLLAVLAATAGARPESGQD